MTIKHFLSPSVGKWVVETNKKYPDISAKEFCDMFESWFNKNEESIALNESIDMSKYSRLVEGDGFDEFDDFGEFEEPVETEPETEPEVKSEPTHKESTKATVFDDDDFGDFEGDDTDPVGTFKDVEGGDKKVEHKPVTVKALSDEETEKIASKIKGKYPVNNGKDFEHNIFSVVNAWYDECIMEGEGENLLKHNRITLLDTGVVENMCALFAFTNIPNLDLSEWDTSAVKTMEGMFYKSTFDNNSIEDWDVSMCVNFDNMFTQSRFSGDISRWTPGKILETVYDEFGRPEMVVMKDRTTGKEVLDSEGKPVYDVKKRRVDAPLPEVGSRKFNVNDRKRKKTLEALTKLDRENKEAEEREKEKRISAFENHSLKNIVDFDTFINEGFIDTVKKGINKVKNTIKQIGIKINDYFVAVFKDDGSTYNATSKFTTLNYIANGNVKGVTAFSGADPFLNSNVKSTATISKSNEYYGVIEKDSVEYKNYLTFLEMIGKQGGNVSEARMPLSSVGSGVDGIADIGSDFLKTLLKEQLFEAEAYTDKPQTLLIFGAPGIGKSSIPKEVINLYNKSERGKSAGKKALLVIECGDLAIDGFHLPIPTFQSLGKVISDHPEAVSKSGVSDEELKKFSKVTFRQVVEAPKTWLPVYEESLDDNENDVLDAIANGRTIRKMVDVDGVLKRRVEETTEGGIILFDEFLRADPELFKILMQILLNRRTMDGKVFGSKWAFLCCSNRPYDDDEVKNSYELLSAAASTRFLKGVYNFVPDFYDWKEWAEKKGGFDPYTLEFISQSVKGNREDIKVTSDEGEKTATTFQRWHNVDTEDKSKFLAPMPRTWAAVMTDLNKYMKANGYSDITEVPKTVIYSRSVGKIGKEMADKYANYMESVAKEGGVKIKKLFTTDGYTIDTETYGCAEISKRVCDYISTNYFRRNGDVKLPTDLELYTMARNMHGNYGRNEGSFLVAMHSNIVSDIFNIKSTDDKIINRLHNYLKAIGNIYHVKFADDKPIIIP